MDACFIVRPGGRHETLRYALRSLVNVTDFDPSTDRVWIIGTKPDWITNVEFVKGNLWDGKSQNIFRNWLTFARLEHGPERFIAFNDDIFAHRQTVASDCEWQEPLRDRVARQKHGNWWRTSLAATLAYCETLTAEPKSFELHRPVVMDRGKLLAALSEIPLTGEPPQWRSVYGNRWDTGTTQVPDVKVKHDQPLSDVELAEPWLSTGLQSWRGGAGQLIRSKFSEPSRYEKGV